MKLTLKDLKQVGLKNYREYSEQIQHLFPEEFKSPNALTRNVTLQVTEDCNLRCTYCYQHNKKHTFMDLETGKKAIDFLLNSNTENNKYINSENSPALILEFIGGEPLLAVDLIIQLIEYFKEQSILKNHPWALRHRFSICSNGLLYFNPKVQELFRKYGNEISFSISIDGIKELHDQCRIQPNGEGSYDIAIAAVEDYRKKYGKTSMGSKMTIAPENIKWVSKAIKNLTQLNYTNINLNCVFEEGWNNELATELYNQLKESADYLIENELYKTTRFSIFDMNIGKPIDEKENSNWCGGTGKMLAIDYKGDIYPCLRYMKSSVGDKVEPLKIGNIYEGIGVKEKDKLIIQDLEAITRRSQSTDECFNCPIAGGCAWCSAYNYQEFGTANKRATYICPMHKARVLANVYYWNSIFRKEGMGERFKNWVPEEWALEIIDKDELDMLNKLAELN